MKGNHLVISAALLLACTSCKIEISVPQHGQVETESGAYVCEAGDTCVINVVDVFFDETFIAKPASGYSFTSWRTKRNAFCGGKQAPCPLSTTLFPDTPLMQFLDSESIFFLEPVFGQPNTWAENADMLIGGGAISSCVVRGILYVFGLGWRRSGIPEFVAKYEPATDRWSSLPKMPSPQGWATANAVRNKCYVIGGASRFGGPGLTTVNEFDPARGTWQTRAPLPKGRTLAASATVNGKIYVVGGGDRDSFLAPHRAPTAIYDPSTDEWTTGADIPTTRILLAAGTINGFIYAVGGRDLTGARLDILERYDPATDTWSKGASESNGRWGHTASVIRENLYVMGGQTDTGLSGDVELYNPETDQWISRADMKQIRWGHGSMAIDGRIIAFGGFNSTTDPSAPPLAATETFSP